MRGRSALAAGLALIAVGLAAACGTDLELTADGHDADNALDALCALINDRFDEGE